MTETFVKHIMKYLRIEAPLTMTKVSSKPVKIKLIIIGMVMAQRDLERVFTLVTFFKVIEVVMEN